ncbi:hypothetical protein QFC20_006194 [Naganishia adeliensis]|uniref:Uncharacterized protein n=1 Tax=Naganishia adeliensis TaxID=92952 RepID=A0ACC2VE90_9TREE|nr:hypothetical protein QFC20_006194 [Naganishia adeliensis]
MSATIVAPTPPHTPVFASTPTNSDYAASSSHILGIGTAFPQDLLYPQGLEEFATKWCEPSESLSKTLMVNNHTQINQRPLVQRITDPLLNQEEPPKIRDVNKVFMEKGVELALAAAKKALADWGGNLEDITHLATDRTLLHGVGCAGGLSLVRLAHQLSRVPVDPSPTSKPNRILIISTEVTSTLCRSEIDELNKASKAPDGDKGWPNVSLCLFSDGASAMIVGAANSEGHLKEHEQSSFEILDCITETVPDTVEDLGFNVDEYGWKAIISQRVPKLTSQAVPQLYNRLMSKPSLALRSKVSKTLSYLASPPSETQPKTLDWLIHPGGSLIISKIENQLGLELRRPYPGFLERLSEQRKHQLRWRGSKIENAPSDVKVNGTNGHASENGLDGVKANGGWEKDESTPTETPEDRAEKYADLGIHEETSVTEKAEPKAEGRLKRKPDSDLAEIMATNKRSKTEDSLVSNGRDGASA